MTRENRELLIRSGCHFERFRPLNPFDFRRVNNRNHRRVLVVDGDPSVDIALLQDRSKLRAILKGGAFVKDAL